MAAEVTIGQFVQPNPEKNHMQRRMTASLAGQERNKLETALRAQNRAQTKYRLPVQRGPCCIALHRISGSTLLDPARVPAEDKPAGPVRYHQHPCAPAHLLACVYGVP